MQVPVGWLPWDKGLKDLRKPSTRIDESTCQEKLGNDVNDVTAWETSGSIGKYLVA